MFTSVDLGIWCGGRKETPGLVNRGEAKTGIVLLLTNNKL